MDGGDHSLSSPDKDDNDEDHASTPALAAEADHALLFKVPLVDAPILLFVCFHKALLDELRELRHSVEMASLEDNSNSTELILKLQQRLEFLKLALKYHCAAEDEVIFLALDVQVKNAVSTYSLEHNRTDELFNSVFHCLDELKDAKENMSKPLQDVVYCIGILQTSICRHMLKEEEQVFPLLMRKFSPKEQASLVWQFICSVPIVLLEEALPWMISFLSADKQAEVMQCLKDIAPMEKPLQEVLISWLGINKPSFTETHFQSERNQYGNRSLHMEKSLGLHLYNRKSKEISNWMRDKCLEIEDGINPVNILHLWHGAIKKDIKEILKEIYQIRNSSNFQNLDSVLIQLKFLVDVLIFYSNAQKKFFYPLLNKVTYGWWFKAIEQFPSESHIEDLQWLLFHSTGSGMPLCKYAEKLCIELELLLVGVNKQFAVQETEVFPFVIKNHCNTMQERLLGLSLHMMPLGLLKCVITWFAAQLSEKESRSILYHLEQGNLLVHKSLSSLLHEWFCIGYSGKTTTEKFRQDLLHMFKSRCSFLPGKNKEADGFSFSGSDKPVHKRSTFAGKNCVLYRSSSGSNNGKTYDTPYSSEINLHIFFPATVMKLQNCSRTHAANSSLKSFLDDSKLIDIIFFFHKAIKKDLDYLVIGSSQLYGNPDLLMDFQKRFHLIRFLCQIHSDAEDEIVFPALEAKGQVQNISHSYTIDHKFEFEHFSKISSILDKMCALHFSVSNIESNTMDQKMVKHRQLCGRLHEMCKSMQKLLSDHIDNEEIEVWPVIREFFSSDEQRKVVGCMLGRVRAEILQDMIPWLMASLTQEEQHILKILWSMATKNTMFDEWLGEWWEGYSIAKPTGESNCPPLETLEPLNIISKYLSEEDFSELKERTPSNKCINFSKDHLGADGELCPNCPHDGKGEVPDGYQDNNECSECMHQSGGNNRYACNKVEDVTSPTDNKGLSNQFHDNYGRYDHLLSISQDGLERAIRRVSRDSSLDPQKKSYIIQTLLMSRWIVRQQISSSEVTATGDEQEFPGQHPSYRDPLELIYGCTHYKRNCKLLAACCNRLYTCIRCHDEESDHSIDRKSITKMMCMKCLIIQPINGTCSTVSCSNLSMAKYYCRICRLFDDEREIYHCPYCNLCRVGKGLGVDYFHCMNCNACMSRSLAVHICREKFLENNCPICHEYIFTSASPVKVLPCGHVMHSTCFKEYTCFNYTCPFCSKSLGDMQVYFRMLDALLVEEKISDELTGQTQAILCNDCEKKGDAPFHLLYHKCPFCASYNTRVL